MRIVTLSQLEERIERRKTFLGLSGNDYVLPNSGVNRTREKRDLLRAIAMNAAEQGRQPTFGAHGEASIDAGGDVGQ